MYFSSKRDTWIGLLLWIPMIAGLVLTTWIPLANGQYDPTGTFIYTIQGGTIKISGEYGEVIKLSDITGIVIKDQIPEIQLKTNGSGLGSMLKGYFKLKGIGQAKLFVDTQKPPFIFISVKSGLRIVNTEKSSETDQLYEKLLEAWKQNAGSK